MYHSHVTPTLYAGRSVFVVEFCLLDAPFHASLIKAAAMMAGLRGTMLVPSKWCAIFKVSFKGSQYMAFVYSRSTVSVAA